jgi:hypothetical protein
MALRKNERAIRRKILFSKSESIRDKFRREKQNPRRAKVWRAHQPAGGGAAAGSALPPISPRGMIGLGYVGLPLAVEMALAGYETVGIDVDAR